MSHEDKLAEALADLCNSDSVYEDLINNPNHYGGSDNPLEVIKIIDWYELGFNLGNTVKYILRADNKDNRKQDLEKALYYLRREIDNT